jgi:uncharacterized membrane protein HdeD (DUF308 family)
VEEIMNIEGSALLTGQGRMLVPGAARYWWALLITGVAWLVIGWVVLRADVNSLATVGVLLGIVFIASGVNEVAVASMVTGGWKILHYVLAVVFLLAGLWAFIRPIDTFFALASVLGLILLFYGAFEITRGVASRGETPYWWASLISGVLLLLLAAWVSTSDPQTLIARRTYLILFWVGFMALLRGINQIMLGFTLRSAGAEVTRTESGATTGADAAGMVPAQERRLAPQPESMSEQGPRV